MGLQRPLACRHRRSWRSAKHRRRRLAAPREFSASAAADVLPARRSRPRSGRVSCAQRAPGRQPPLPRHRAGTGVVIDGFGRGAAHAARAQAACPSARSAPPAATARSRVAAGRARATPGHRLRLQFEGERRPAALAPQARPTIARAPHRASTAAPRARPSTRQRVQASREIGERTLAVAPVAAIEEHRRLAFGGRKLQAGGSRSGRRLHFGDDAGERAHRAARPARAQPKLAVVRPLRA